MSSTNSQEPLTTPLSQPSHLLAELQEEAVAISSTAWAALATSAWLWPVCGLFYAIFHPQIILSVWAVLVKSFGTSAIVFGILAFFTYIPQAALLSLVTGPLGPLLAIFLLGAESIFLLTFFAKPLFLEPALQHTFDATLLEKGQRQLVKEGKTKNNAFAERAGGVLVRPLQALSRDGIFRYLVTLPLNIVPVIGTISFVCINGHGAGPSWHARYFQLKGFDNNQRKAFAEKHRAEYTAFGISALIFSFIPIAGLIFTFTNTVGAALWAADLEAKSNLIDQPAPDGGKPKSD